MHRLTGAKLTKLIDVLLWIGNAGTETAAPALKRRRILAKRVKSVKQENLEILEAKLK